MISNTKKSIQYLALLSILLLASCDNSDAESPKINEVKSDFNAVTHIFENISEDKNKIAILIKDNVDIVGAPNTAGSLAMLDNVPSEDAFLVKQLRSSNYSIIGKTNLSEWANFRSFDSISGWSSYGGQTIHALGNNFNPCGSSSGSAVVVALGLVKASIGTETNGSISCPASVNGIVGIKPTVGVVSRSGIIPISPTQDTAGPMAVNVTEAARLLSAISGPDYTDPVTLKRPKDFSQDFIKDLNVVTLKGKKFGLLPSGNEDPEAKLLLDKIVDLIEGAGGEIIEITDTPTYPGEEELFVLLYEFKHSLESYLKESNAGLKTLESIMDFNEENKEQTMQYFDQSIFEASLEAANEHTTYQESLRTVLNTSREFINSSMDSNGLTALIGLTRGPAWKIDSIEGDDGALKNYPSWGNGAYAAMAGTPHITIPFGSAYDLPIGLSIMGKAWSDHEMVQLAFTLEQLLK